MRTPRSRILAAIGLVALVAFAVRAVSLDAQSLWRDEVDALRFATAPWTQMFSNFTRPGWNGPLYFLLLRGWIGLTGRSEYAMRFLSLLFGVLCVPLVYALGRRLFDRPTGLLAALLVCASPYLAWYSQEVKMYTLVTALALTTIYGLRRAVEGAGWHWWVVQVVATSLAFYAHILAALLIPVQILLYLAWWPQARRRWAAALASLACLTLPYLPLAAWQAPLALQARETGFHAYTLGEMAEILLNGWTTGMLSRGWPWGPVLVAGLAVGGLLGGHLGGEEEGARGQLERELRNRFALLVWLVTPLLAVWLISLRQPLFTDRYLTWTAPAFYLLAALGLASVGHLGGRRRRAQTTMPDRRPIRFLGLTAALLLAGTVLVLDGTNLWQQATVPIKSDFRAAAAHVAAYRAPVEPRTSQPSAGEWPFKCYLPLVVLDRHTFDDLIIFQIPYGRYTFDYYFPIERYPWAEGLYTNHRSPDGSYLTDEQGVAQRMQELTAGHRTIWLVATEAHLWDERRLVQAWLDAHARRVDEAHFMRVDVYRYEK